MKIQVQIVPDADDNSVLTVCDEHGVPLPNQEKVELFNSVLHNTAKVTVTFVIDNDNVKLAVAQ